MRQLRRAICVVLALLAVAAPAAAAPEGQLTWGVHISLAPTWFDPAETLGIITPFMVMYAVHDALAKAMPGNPTAPSLAESWQMSGSYVYGTYPDLDSLFKDQAAELDRKKREALLYRMQQLMHDKVMHIPIWELAFINGHGPRVQESGLGLIPGHAYSAPYGDVKLKAK